MATTVHACKQTNALARMQRKNTLGFVCVCSVCMRICARMSLSIIKAAKQTRDTHHTYNTQHTSSAHALC